MRTQGSQENTSGDTAGNAVLQTQIQDALRKEPTLTNSSVKVTALAETIELTGSVASSRERLNAGRLAQSYARGKRVVNHIVVSGHALDSADKLNANHPAILARPAGTPLSNQ